MQIVSPKYSFVKFDSVEAVDNCCDGEQAFCVPVIEENDTYFQVQITSEDYDEIQALMARPLADFQLLLLNGSTNTSETFEANTLRNWTLTDALNFERYRTGLYEITLQWRNIFKDIKSLIACGGCFQIAIVFIDSTLVDGEFTDEFSDEFETGEGGAEMEAVTISNCFKRHCADCYTAVLEYYNDDDYAEFNYCNVTNAVNRVRLPFYLSQPKIVEDKVVYRKSNGAIKQTKSLLTKEYLAQTDHLSEIIHEKISIALAHDVINVLSDKYAGGISKNGEYAIEWTDNICVAPASFKALATPFGIRNNNCIECIPNAVCDPVAIPEIVLPDAYEGVPYSQTATLTGTLPFVLSAVVKPSWMTIEIAEDIITFSGTPDALGTDSTISFAVSNGCGIANTELLISVVEAPCIAASFDETPILPNGYNGEPYNYTIYLVGTGPFVLSGITKPAWMNINVVGSSIQLTGTPNVTDVEIPVEFDIENCTEDVLNFSGIFDVSPARVYFTETTLVSNEGLNNLEIANIKGTAGMLVTIKFDIYTNDNGGTLLTNGTALALNATFNITLDGSGEGSFTSEIYGVYNPGSTILGRYTIISVTPGVIGTPFRYQNTRDF